MYPETLARRPKGTDRFWKTAVFMRERASPWTPTCGYELRRYLPGPRADWLFCLKMHVVADAGELLLQSTVTIWPPSLTKREAAGLSVWYRGLTRALTDRGYRDGRWRPSPTDTAGKWGNFTKPLASLAAFRREAGWLERIFDGRARSPFDVHHTGNRAASSGGSRKK